MYVKTFAHTIYILCKQLFNIRGLSRVENTTQHSINNRDVLHWSTNGIHSTLAVAARQSWSKSSWLCGVGILQTHLQESDQGRGRAALAIRGVGQSWSAIDRQCSQRMALETAIKHCSWMKTFRTCTVNITDLLRALMQHACLFINN